MRRPRPNSSNAAAVSPLNAVARLLSGLFAALASRDFSSVSLRPACGSSGRSLPYASELCAFVTRKWNEEELDSGNRTPQSEVVNRTLQSIRAGVVSFFARFVIVAVTTTALPAAQTNDVLNDLRRSEEHT